MKQNAYFNFVYSKFYIFSACKNAVRLAQPFKLLGIGKKKKEVFCGEMSSLHKCCEYL